MISRDVKSLMDVNKIQKQGGITICTGKGVNVQSKAGTIVDRRAKFDCTGFENSSLSFVENVV